MHLPEWVKTEEAYQPRRDRDYFIFRSLLRVMNVLLALRRQAKSAALGHFSAAGTLGFFLGWLLLCVAAHNTAFLCSQLALVLVLLCFFSGQAIVRVLRTALGAGIFSGLLVLPSLWLGNHAIIFLIPFKTFLTVASLGILQQYLSWNKLTQALGFYRLPREVIFILDTTLRYIALLGELAGDMLIALKMRSIGNNPRKSRAFGSIMGRLFLRSREMSQAMYEAMVCRCFTGEYPAAATVPLQRADLALLCILALYGYCFGKLEGLF